MKNRKTRLQLRLVSSTQGKFPKFERVRGIQSNRNDRPSEILNLKIKGCCFQDN